MRVEKKFWGVFCIAAAILVIVNKLGYFTGINVRSLLFTVILVPIVVSGFLRRNYFNLCLGIAFLLIVYAKPLNITVLVPWTILSAALLLGIGLSILLPSEHGWTGRFHSHHAGGFKGHGGNYEKNETVDHVDGNDVNCYVSMAGSCKYLHSDCLKSGRFDCSLGYLKVYFDNVRLHPDGAEINVSCLLGNTELFIPANWPVIVNIDCVMGNVNEHTRIEVFDGPALTITGKVHLGNLEIVYI